MRWSMLYTIAKLNLSYIENYSVATCNAQTKLSENGVEWNEVKAKWMLVSMELEDGESGMRVK